MSQYLFGTGQLFASNVGGGAPLRIGALQNVEVGFQGDLKELFGQYQFPLAVARGKTKVEGKFATANIDVSAFNSLFFAQAAGVTTGQYKQAINEAGAIPTTPFQLTAANAAHFFRDLGVTDVLSGNPLKWVAASPATGQYSVNATTGVYTFAAADTGKAVLLNYLYQDTTEGGTLTITNQLVGLAPTLELICSQTFQGNVTTLCLFAITASKLQLPLKMDDFAIADIDFQAQANAAGNVGFITTTSATGGGA